MCYENTLNFNVFILGGQAAENILKGTSRHGYEVYGNNFPAKTSKECVFNLIDTKLGPKNNWIFRVDRGTKISKVGTPWGPHVNINPRILNMKDPHIKISPQTLKSVEWAAPMLSSVVNKSTEVLTGAAIVYDVYRIGNAMHEDGGLGRNTVKTSVGVFGGWVGASSGAWAGAEAGAFFGSIFGPFGTVVGTVAGTIIGGVSGAVGGEICGFTLASKAINPVDPAYQNV